MNRIVWIWRKFYLVFPFGVLNCSIWKGCKRLPFARFPSMLKFACRRLCSGWIYICLYWWDSVFGIATYLKFVWKQRSGWNLWIIHKTSKTIPMKILEMDSLFQFFFLVLPKYWCGFHINTSFVSILLVEPIVSKKLENSQIGRWIFMIDVRDHFSDILTLNFHI